MEETAIGTFTYMGLLFTALIAIALLYALGCVTVDKVQEFRRSRERKWKMECKLEELEARVGKLEGGD